MHPADWRLINGQLLEALPAAVLRARGNATARALAQNDWLIRRKHDGKFLAVATGERVRELRRGSMDRLLRADLHSLAQADAAGDAQQPLTGLLGRLHSLGLDQADYAAATGLALVAEPSTLVFAGRDRYSRPLWLRAEAAHAWRRMHSAARVNGVWLEAISGYRSHDYQLGIFRRKLARGQSIDDILKVNAAPGFSEHHSGEAMDVGTPGEPAAEESFEATAAFGWLAQHAGAFGFHMSYPRGNEHGIDYEPWHWRHATVPGSS